MLPDIKVVEDDRGLAIHAVKLKGDALSAIVGIQFEDATVPANTRLGILAPQGVETFVFQIGIVLEWQLHGPVMREIDLLPIGIIKGE